MKFSRRSFSRLAQAAHRRNSVSGNRASVECRCPACGQIVDTLADQSLDRSGTAVAPGAGIGEIEKQSSNAIDTEKLLHFSQQLYAHALTLQEVVRNGGEVTYEVLRPRCDRQAAQQFEVFYRASEQLPQCRVR